MTETPFNILTGLVCAAIGVCGIYFQICAYLNCSARTNTQHHRVWRKCSFCGSYWDEGTCSIWRAEDAKKRLYKIPFKIFISFTLLCTIGGVFYGLLTAIDPQKDANWTSIGSTVLGVALLGLSFFFKALLNVVLLASTLIWSVYQFFIYGAVSFIPLFKIVSEYLLGSVNAEIQWAYALICLGYSIYSALGNTFSYLISKVLDPS